MIHNKDQFASAIRRSYHSKKAYVKLPEEQLPDTTTLLISWPMPTFWKGRNITHFAAARKHLGLYPGGEATQVFRYSRMN